MGSCIAPLGHGYGGPAGRGKTAPSLYVRLDSRPVCTVGEAEVVRSGHSFYFRGGPGRSGRRFFEFTHTLSPRNRPATAHPGHHAAAGTHPPPRPTVHSDPHAGRRTARPQCPGTSTASHAHMRMRMWMASPVLALFVQTQAGADHTRATRSANLKKLDPQVPSLWSKRDRVVVSSLRH